MKEIKPEANLLKYYLASFWLTLIISLLAVFIPMFFAPFPLNAILFWTVVALIAAGVPFIFWIPAFYRELDYSIEDDVVRSKKGVFFKKRVTVPFTKITNVDITQGPLQRYFNIGTIHVQTAGASVASGQNPELKMEGIRELDALRDEIMDRVKTFYRKQNAAAEVKAEDAQTLAQDDSTLMKILQELTAIRKGLENK